MTFNAIRHPRHTRSQAFALFLVMLFVVASRRDFADSGVTGITAQKPPASPTTTYTVNDPGDAGAGSGTTGDLRYCITQANFAGGSNTISFSVTGTINLMSALPNLSASALTINGPGASLLTIRRAPNVTTLRIFQITSSGTITLSGLTLANGNASGGGAVFKSFDGTLNIDNCVLADNASNAGGGGALYNSGNGPINLTNSALSGNSANGGEGGEGGALRNDGTGTISISGSTFSGNSASNIACIENNNTGVINITNTVITGNSTANDAGAIVNARTGTVTVTGCTISDNHVGNVGGAILNGSTGTVTVTDSTISGNSSGSLSVGGGIYNNIGTVNVIRSTISGNSSRNGGGIYNNTTGTINVTNSTISGNSASLGGGGLYFSSLSAGQGTIIGSTITGNSANAGGGINVSNAGSVVTITNTIIAGNTAANTSKDISGPLTSGGYNLIGNNTGGTITPTTGDQIGTSGSPSNPLLGPLQNNGGPTFTHALLTGSPAIDAGNAFGLTTDQRGFTRQADISGVPNIGDGSDIGAFEAGNFVIVGGNTTFTPAVAPVGAVRINVSTSPSFKGTFVADPTTGVVRITNAQPAGAYLVTVKAFDSVGAITTSTFDLFVQTPSPSCATPTFTNAADINTGSNACSVAVGDFNNDGKQDLAVANNTSDTVSIRFGNGMGGFTGAINVPVGPASHPGHGIQPDQVVIGDFNNDGNQDFATANYYTGTVSIRLGDGAGNFTGETPTSEITTGTNAHALAVGDFNSDGKPDLVVASPSPGTVSILLGDGLGAFTIAGELGFFAPQSVAVGDFNNDGKQDLAIVSFESVAIRLGDGLGGFSGSTSINVGNGTWPSAVVIGDFNNDGKQDFATANPGFNVTNNTVSVRLGDGLGGFSGATTVTVGTGPYAIAVGDFNNDGKQDFATANYTGSSASVRFGDGLGGFSGSLEIGVGVRPISAAIGDFNGDGRLDFATANVSSNNATVRLGSCTPNTAPTINAQAGVTRQQGSPVSNSQIATVGDAESGASGVTVTVIGANPASGVTVSNIVNSNGTVTADIRAGCTANNVSFTLQVSDGSVTTTATLNVTVTANTPPTLTYSNQSVVVGGSLTINPATGLTDNGSIASVMVQSPGTYTGTISVNSSGVVSISNANPPGTHTIVIRAVDNCGGASGTTDATFMLTVNCPTIALNSASLPDGLVGAAYNQPIIATGGSAPYIFVVGAGAVPAGLMLNNDGTWSGVPTTASPYNFTVLATDSNGCTASQAYPLTIINTATWNGNTGNNWNTAANWTPGFVPAAPNDVVIPASGVSLEPTLSAATAIVNNLTVAAGRTLSLSGQEMTVNGTLSLSGGVIATGANTLTLSAAASISRTGGQITGNLRKQFGGGGSFIYAVGTANGYSPVDVTVTAGTGELTVKAVQGPQPIVNASQSLQRYWTLNGSGMTVNLVFHYLDPTDIPAGGSDASYRIIRVSEGFALIYPDNCAGGSPCVDPVANTMSINGVSSFSDWTAGAAAQPTAVRLEAMKVSRYDNGALIEWQTGYEADNLGFNVYREVGGHREVVNREIVAGSALVTGRAALLAGRGYGWWDGIGNPDSDVNYYIESIDLNGKTTLHGPIKPQRVGGKPPAMSQADVLSRIGQSAPRIRQVLPGQPESQTIIAGSPAAQTAQEELAGRSAVKLSVRETGWYRVTQPELMAAGLDPQADPRRLQLFVDGIEQPMLVVGESDGRLDATDAIEFYGTALDTPSTDAHVYWLAVGSQPGKRISIIPSAAKSGGAASFAYTIESRPRSLYFSGLLNGDAENFFGRVITAQPVEQTLMLQHLDPKPPAGAELEIALQGVTDTAAAPDHTVSVALNGVIVGRVVFDGRAHQSQKFSIYQSLLREGDNTVILIAEGGPSDISLVDYVRVTYWHTYAADDNALLCTASASTQTVKGIGSNPGQTISGFRSPLIRVIDVTDPSAITELAGTITQQGESYAATVAVPGGGVHTLMALTDERIKRPAAIRANQPSSWRQAANGADLLVITRRDFFAALAPLLALRQSQGLSVAVVDVEDLYDEFSYGNKSTPAVKDFIRTAKTSWKKPPQFVLLAGDASYDAKNYLGFGDLDLVPTKLIDTALMETASDDWLADVDGDGLADLGVGRLPFRTADEAARLVAKLIAYEQSRPGDEMLLVADQDDGHQFEMADAQLRALISGSLRINEIQRGQADAATAKAELLAAINRGQKIVNYAGHGSVNQWRGNLLTNDDAAAMTNADHLSVFVMMTCLTGYFDDPALDSLAESLLKAERGGAVAVWASSGMTLPAEQAAMNQQLYRLLFGAGGSTLRLGDAVRRAKAAIGDADVRQTWVLLGDPTMKLK